MSRPAARGRGAAQGRPPAAALGRRGGERGDAGVPREDGADDLALDADAAAVDQPHLCEAGGVGGLEVVGDGGGDVAGGEGVQVERVLDRDPDGLVLAGYSSSPPITCCCQCPRLRRSSPESLHCQNVAARSKNVTSTSATCSARAVSATRCVTIWRTNGIGVRPRRGGTSSGQRMPVPGRTRARAV